MTQDYENYEEDEGAHKAIIARALSAIRRRLGLIALLTTVGTVLGGIYAYSKPNYYRATAVVQIDPRDKSITNIDNVFSDMRGDNASIESEAKLILSTPLLRKVVDTLNLRADPEFGGDPAYEKKIENLIPGRATSLEDLLARKTDQPNGPRRDFIVTSLADHLSARRPRNTLLIELTAYSGNPKKAALIANTLADVYLRDKIYGKQDAASIASELLDQKLKMLRGELARAETDVERFKAKHGIFEEGNSRLGSSELARLMEQTVQARNATAEARAKYETAKNLLASGRNNGNLTDVLQSATIMRMKDELARARRRRAELSTKYGPRHPEMQQSIADVREAQVQLDGEVNRLVANISNDFDVARSRERQLIADLNALKLSQSSNDQVAVELAELKRRAEKTRSVYETLLARYKSTSQTKNLQLPDVRIVERANIALQPSGPNRKRALILAFIGSLGAGVLLILALEFMTTGISRPEDAERIFDITHLSSMPSIADRSGANFNPAYALRMLLSEPRSTYSEAIRNIRRELDVQQGRQHARIIALASSLPEEGTEIIASNLAHHYAMTGNRVLLIDGDLRRASLTRRLAASRETGLLEVLWHGYTANHAILKDQSTGLHFLPAMGPSPLEPASPELLAASHMERVVADLKSQFDTIIVDVPPLLPIIDGRILCDYADQIVFSIAWRKTPKQLAKRALRLLGPNQDKVSGVVVTEVSADALEDSMGFTSRPVSQRATQQELAA